MTARASDATHRKSRRGRLGCLTKAVVVLAALVLLTVLFWRPALTSVGRFLVVDEPPVASDVVVVAGGNVERIAFGIELVERGLAPRILVLASKEDCPAFWGFSCPDVITARIVVMGLKREQVIIETRSNSTRTDAIFVREDIEREGMTSAIVISDPFHMRRTSLAWRRVFEDSDVRLTFAAVPFEKTFYFLDGWWGRERELIFVFNEYAKLALYWVKGYL